MKSGWIAALVIAAVVGVFMLWRGRASDSGRVIPALPDGRQDLARAGNLGNGHSLGPRPNRRIDVPAAPVAADREPPPADEPGGADSDDGGRGGQAARGPGSGAGGSGGRGSAGGHETNRADAAPPVPVMTFATSADEKAPDGGDPIYELVFDGSADRGFPTDSQEVANIRRMAGSAGTISFWLMPQWEAGSQDRANFLELGDSGLEIVKDGENMRFRFPGSDGSENSVDAFVGDWAQNKWRAVVATWVGPQLNLYVDGALVSSNTFSTAPDLQAVRQLYIGSAFASGETAAPATVASVGILNRPLEPGEVAGKFKYDGGPPQLHSGP